MKKILAFVFLTIATSAFADLGQVVGLINQGKGIDAIKILNARLEASSGDEKLRLAYSIADACMLLDDEICIKKVFAENWSQMHEYLNRYNPKNPRELDTWRSIYDANTTLYYYVILASLDEKQYNQALTYEDKNFTGNPFSSHAGLKLVGKAAIAAFVGKQSYAEQQLRRARALILNKDPGTIQAQSNLAHLLETSLFYLNDSRDIKRWFDANIATFQQTGVDPTQFLNPYVYQRIALVIYNAGILDTKKQNSLIEDIHSRFKYLQISEESKLLRKKEEFYAFLAFSDPSNTSSLNFNPIEELGKLSSTSYASVGVKAYLSIYDGNKNIDELTRVLDSLNANYSKFGLATKLNLAPTKAILESLISKSEVNKPQEIAALERYIDSTLDLYSKKGYRIGDNNPIQTKPAISVQKYVVDRLGELSPKSEKRVNLGLLILQSINSSQFGDEEASYSILSKAKNDIEIEQTLNFITLKERYGNLVSQSYKVTADALIKNQKIDNAQDKLIVLADRSSFLLDMFSKSNEQLVSLRENKNDSFITNYKDISSRLKNDELAIFSSSTESFDIIATISNKSANIKILPRDNKDFSSARKALGSSTISELSNSAIKDASAIISKTVFSDLSEARYKNIYLLNGPTITGIPYTLLTSPYGKKWLIEDVRVRAFYAPPQFFAMQRSQSFDKNSKYKYVAFANPILRSKDEIDSVKNLAGLIRGANGKTVTSLPELPETEIEVNTFAKSLGGNSVIYSGKRATIENLFQSNLDDIEVLGFATHGLMVGELDGVQSPSIVLTPNGDNGIVTSEILFSLHGSPKVAILSTCNSRTAAESLNQSEITSLSSSFALKGTKSVIASYWAVNSDGTSLLMSTMANYISKGLSYSDSLARSQIGLIYSKNYSHPSIWAAFVSTGDFLPATKNQPSNNTVIFKKALIDTVVTSADDVYLSTFKIEDSKPRVLKVASDLKTSSIKISDSENYSSIKISKNGANLFYGLAGGGKYGVYKSEGSSNSKFLCSFPLDNNWFVRGFIVSDKVAYVLVSRPKDALYEPALASVNLSSCELKTSIFSGLSFSATDELGIESLRSSDRVLFYLQKKIQDSKPFQAYADELNLPRKCNFQTKLDYYVFDDSLRLLNSGSEKNLRLLSNSFNTPNWVHSIYTNECTFETYPKKINTAWFEEKFLFHDEKGALIRQGLSDDELLIGKNFSQIIGWSTGESEDLIYVDGSPGLTSVLFSSRSNLSVSKKAREVALNSEFSQYVYQKSTIRWSRISSSEQCNTPKPLSFNGKILLACNQYESANPIESSSYLYRSKLN